MQFQAKWFRSATITALLAVMALFVSPAFALGCCCGGPEAHTSLTAPVAAPERPGHSCCADDEASEGKAGAEQRAPHCATLERVCDCAAVSTDQPFVFSDQSHFPHFAPAFVVPQSPRFAVAPRSEELLAVSSWESARPRSPSSPTAAGRAPPALALS